MNTNETLSGVKCVILNDRPYNIDKVDRYEYGLRNEIARTPKGGKQNEYIKSLLNSGYVLNPDSSKDRKSLDTLIERVQFKIKMHNKYWNSNYESINSNFEILYGKLSDEKFGYYMYNKEVM